MDNSKSMNPEVINPWKRVVAIGVLSAAVLNACGSDDAESTTSEPAGTEVEVTGAVLDGAVLSTDESLREANFMCGGEMDQTSMEDFSYKFDFFSASEENMELAESMKDITVTDARWGMGEEAFDLVLENMFINGTTDAKDQTTGDTEFDALLSGVFARTLDTDTTYVNGDCRTVEDQVTMPSPSLPAIRLQAGESAEGVMMPMTSYDAFMAAVNKDEQGNSAFNIVRMTITGADGKPMEVFFVDLFANGCDNPIRIKTPEPEEPTEPTTPPTVPPTTPPTVPPTTPPTGTLPPPTTTTTIPPKIAEPLPPTGVPADTDPGTPDVPGEGPAGQTPNNSGYIPSETPPPSQAPNTTQLPAPVTAPNTIPAVEGTAPATTNAPVVAPNNPTPSNPETGPLPPRP
jgi:hypothetical protein